MITRAGIGHTYSTTEKKITKYWVEVTKTPLHVELVDQISTKAHQYTNKIPWLFNAVCWLFCKHNEAAIDAWVFHKTKRWQIVITDEQRDEFRGVMNSD